MTLESKKNVKKVFRKVKSFQSPCFTQLEHFNENVISVCNIHLSFSLDGVSSTHSHLGTLFSFTCKNSIRIGLSHYLKHKQHKFAWKMSNLEPKKQHLREVYFITFFFKKRSKTNTISSYRQAREVPLSPCYEAKMREIFTDQTPYVELKKNPLNKLELRSNSLVNKPFHIDEIDEFEKKKMITHTQHPITTCVCTIKKFTKTHLQHQAHLCPIFPFFCTTFWKRLFMIVMIHQIAQWLNTNSTPSEAVEMRNSLLSASLHYPPVFLWTSWLENKILCHFVSQNIAR